MQRYFVIGVLMVLFFLIDFYVFQAVKAVSGDRRWIYIAYWVFTAFSLMGFAIYWTVSPNVIPTNIKTLIAGFFFVNYFSKIVVVLFLLIDDIGRAIRWIVQKIYSGNPHDTPESIVNEVQDTSPQISRSEFLVKTALVAGAIPLVGMTYGIISGAHDYRIRRLTVKLPNLPKAFDGVRIGQISDIHSGSFYNKTAVKGGIEMLLKEKPDVIFFTGDLVNNRASEMKDYIEVFEKIKAPMGVFSTLGNHDYGDYDPVLHANPSLKIQNLKDLIRIHKQMGWDILMNENRELVVGNEKIGILGVENWGKGRFPKYGKLDKAHAGTQDYPVKLLLSHDPSHWDLQVLPDYKDIDIMFAGHTHGMQFGVEIGDFKWSPSQYAYEQWAGMYKKDNQYLYVNRGFGFLGFPGRVGILPELTILELKSV